MYAEKVVACYDQHSHHECMCVWRGGGGTVVSTVGNYESTYLRPVKFRQISFSGCKVEVENVSANQMPGRPSLFSDRPEKHSRGTGR